MTEQITSDYEAESGLKLLASPEECVALRYRAISMIDAAYKGEKFYHFKAVTTNSNGVFVKAVEFWPKHDQKLPLDKITLAFRRDGYVEMYYSESHPANFTGYKETDEFFCVLGGDEAVVVQSKTRDLRPVPVDEINPLIENIDGWHNLIDLIGEPKPRFKQVSR